jgi:hypothetical protein
MPARVDPFSTFEPVDEIDLVLGWANPNPTGDGCPPPTVVWQMARRVFPIGHPAYEHLTRCSPCYRLMRTIQRVDAG